VFPRAHQRDWAEQLLQFARGFHDGRSTK